MLLSDYKIEDIFLNSQYFKHQSKNQQSSISFCSGDHGENKWTIDSKFDIPTKQKTVKDNNGLIHTKCFAYGGIIIIIHLTTIDFFR